MTGIGTRGRGNAWGMRHRPLGGGLRIHSLPGGNHLGNVLPTRPMMGEEGEMGETTWEETLMTMATYPPTPSGGGGRGRHRRRRRLGLRPGG